MEGCYVFDSWYLLLFLFLKGAQLDFEFPQEQFMVGITICSVLCFDVLHRCFPSLLDQNVVDLIRCLSGLIQVDNFRGWCWYKFGVYSELDKTLASFVPFS